MNLADMLVFADIAELTRIAETYDCTCSSHSKNELIQSILSTVQRRDVMESRIGEMNGNDLRFLNSLIFEKRTAYSLEELKARALGGETSANSIKSAAVAAPAVNDANKTAKSAGKSRKTKNAAPVVQQGPDESARLAISRFKRFGWLFNGFSQQTRFLYQVPEDVKTRLGDALERRYRASLILTEEPPVYRDESSLMVDDLVQFLRFVRDNELPLTTEGVLYKRQISQALELFAVNESIPARGGWRFGYGRHFRDYPDRFSLLYDFAYNQGYVVEAAEQLILTENGRNVADRLEQPDQAKLYRFWLKLYKGPIPNLMTLVQWIMRLAGDWVTVNSLNQILQPLVRSFYYDTQRDVFEHRVLTMLMHQGIIRWGKMADGESVIRMTLQGKMLVSGNSMIQEEPLKLGPLGSPSK
jgi:hypothetical protein